MYIQRLKSCYAFWFGLTILAGILHWEVFSLPASGQEPVLPSAEEKTAAEANPLTIENVQDWVKQVQADPVLAEPQKKALLQIYDTIQVELRSKLEDERRAKELATSAEAAPSGTSEMKRRKETPPARDLISESALRSYQLQALQELLQTQKTNLQSAIDGRTKAESDISGREARKKELPKLIAEERAKLLELNEKLAAPTSTPETQDPRLREAETLLHRAQIASLTERIRKREQELRLYEAEAELLPLKKAVLLADERYFQMRVKEIVDELNKRRETKIEEEKRKAEGLAGSVPVELKPLSDRLVRRAHDWLELAKRNTAIELEIEQSKAKYKFWEERNRIMTERSQSHREQIFGVINSWNGLLLRRHRNELPDEGKMRSQLNEHLTRMQQTETLIIELEDWKNQTAATQLDDELMEGVMPQSDGQLSAGLLQQADRLLAAERELVSNFAIDAKNYSDNLFKLSESTQETIGLVQRYRAFIDQHILWIRSANPVGRTDLEQLWPAVQYFFDYHKWLDAGRSLLDELRQKPWQPLLFTVVWGTLVLNTSKMRRAMAKLGEQAHRSTMVDFMPTAKAITFCLLLSLPWPMLFFCLGYRLQHAGSPQSFTVSLGLGFMVAARYFYPLEVIRQVCRSGGLAEMHFEWPVKATQLIRRHLRWLIDLGVPSAAMCAMLFNLGEDRYEHSLGRLCYTILMVVCSLFLTIILRPNNGIFKEYLAAHPGGWADRLRYVWYLGLIVGPLLLCFNSLSGYHYTALRLSMLWHTTIVTLIGLFLLYQIMRRWLLLSRRKIMTDQARHRLEEAQHRDLATGAGGPSAVPLAASESGSQEILLGAKPLDLAHINAQTMRVFVSILVVAAIVSMSYIWSGVLPAVNVLNSITLWNVQGAIPTEQTPITLADLLLAIPIIVLTFVAARNLPGLLEIALLQQLPFQNSVRYAIATLSRYAIILLGVILTFNSIGVRWASIQWLVAALGVGLGFGLQEIFANFVSGLILLFEQPIRVGDVITLGDTTGSVSRIRMRATTITNWDRQELIIPNKDLITGRLLNWTLSDSTNRVVITVGVAFDTDTERACQLIREICEAHQNVLTDPPPTAHFDAFGESTIDIKVRLFLDNLEIRVQTRHELQTQILQRFLQEGIEIAFPQRDLHIRSLPKSLSDFLLPRPNKD